MKQEQLHREDISQEWGEASGLNDTTQADAFLASENASRPSVHFAAHQISPSQGAVRQVGHTDLSEVYNHGSAPQSPRPRHPGDVAQFRSANHENQGHGEPNPGWQGQGAHEGLAAPPPEPEFPPPAHGSRTPEPVDIYGTDKLHFNNVEEARAHRHATTEYVNLPPEHDPTFPHTNEQFQKYARHLTNCLADMTIVEDRKNMDGSWGPNVMRFVSDDPKVRHPRITIEASAWRAVEEAEDLHRNGAKTFPKDKADKFERDMSFGERIYATGRVLRRYKSQSNTTIGYTSILKLIHGPNLHLDCVRGNVKNNSQKSVALMAAGRARHHQGTEEEGMIFMRERAKAEAEAAALGHDYGRKRRRAPEDEKGSKEEEASTRKTKRTKKATTSKTTPSTPTPAQKRRRASPEHVRRHVTPRVEFATGPPYPGQYDNPQMHGQYLPPASPYPPPPQHPQQYSNQYNYPQIPQYSHNPHPHYQQQGSGLGAQYYLQDVPNHGLPPQGGPAPPNTPYTPLDPQNIHSNQPGPPPAGNQNPANTSYAITGGVGAELTSFAGGMDTNIDEGIYLEPPYEMDDMEGYVNGLPNDSYFTTMDPNGGNP